MNNVKCYLERGQWIIKLLWWTHVNLFLLYVLRTALNEIEVVERRRSSCSVISSEADVLSFPLQWTGCGCRGQTGARVPRRAAAARESVDGSVTALSTEEPTARESGTRPSCATLIRVQVVTHPAWNPPHPHPHPPRIVPFHCGPVWHPPSCAFQQPACLCLCY